MRIRKLAAVVLVLCLAGCKTVGVGKKAGGYAEIRATIAHEMLLDNPQVVVLDVRPVENYTGPAGHIAGALSTPFDTIDVKLPELIPYQNSTILVYGDTGEEGERVARVLAAAGFRNVVNIEGGLDAWLARGYRVVNSR